MPESLFSKAAGLRSETWYRCFPVNFAKFLRTTFLTEHLLVAASDYFLCQVVNSEVTRPTVHFGVLKAIVVIFMDPRSFTQITFTCSKLTIETLEKGVKYVQT